jgi:hypothetical protein
MRNNWATSKFDLGALHMELGWLGTLNRVDNLAFQRVVHIMAMINIQNGISKVELSLFKRSLMVSPVGRTRPAHMQPLRKFKLKS